MVNAIEVFDGMVVEATGVTPDRIGTAIRYLR